MKDKDQQVPDLAEHGQRYPTWPRGEGRATRRAFNQEHDMNRLDWYFKTDDSLKDSSSHYLHQGRYRHEGSSMKNEYRSRDNTIERLASDAEPSWSASTHFAHGYTHGSLTPRITVTISRYPSTCPVSSIVKIPSRWMTVRRTHPAKCQEIACEQASRWHGRESDQELLAGPTGVLWISGFKCLSRGRCSLGLGAWTNRHGDVPK